MHRPVELAAFPRHVDYFRVARQPGTTEIAYYVPTSRYLS